MPIKKTSGSKKKISPKKKISSKTSKKLKPLIRNSTIPRDKNYRISFCEPGMGIDPSGFRVNKEFYKELQKYPITRECSAGNAFIFGHSFPLKEYKKEKEMVNDGAMTGLIDITNITQEEENRIDNNSRLWLKIMEDHDYKEDKNFLQDVQNKISKRILFAGRTKGGDVGAYLYVHRDSRDEIDGLIIENNCIFPNTL